MGLALRYLYSAQKQNRLYDGLEYLSEIRLQIHLLCLFQQEFIPLLHRVDFISIAVDQIRIYDRLEVCVGGVQCVFREIKVFQKLAPGKGFAGSPPCRLFLKKTHAATPAFISCLSGLPSAVKALFSVLQYEYRPG